MNHCTTGTWYPPSLGTGGFLAEGQLFTNPPFAPMATNKKINPEQIERELRVIACERIIVKAGRIYTAQPSQDIDYSKYLIIGSDHVLMRPDERTPVSSVERYQYMKWRWMKWASSPADLTFLGCIRFILKCDCNGHLYDHKEEDDEDCISFNDVLKSLRGELRA